MRLLGSFALGSALLVVWKGGCVDAGFTDPVVGVVTCFDVCQTYEDCVDDAYDVDGCRERCEVRAVDEGTQDELDACDECLGDRSCASGSFNCEEECNGILP